jgi:hypothetical protein
LAKERVRGSVMVTDSVRAMEMVNGRGSARASEWVSGSTRWRSGTNQREEEEEVELVTRKRSRARTSPA